MLDGLGIGFAFQASHQAGVVVAAAVLAHDFADGLNTVNVVVKHGGSRPQALRWLLADALAPVVGAAISLFFRLPGDMLALLLAGFVGFFLYIGALDLLPESRRAGSRWASGLATLLGAAFLFTVARFAA
jgi:ZIP family zinc transporter